MCTVLKEGMIKVVYNYIIMYNLMLPNIGKSDVTDRQIIVTLRHLF